MKLQTKKLGEANARRIAVEANVDPRTVRRAYENAPLQRSADARERARAALIKHGYLKE